MAVKKPSQPSQQTAQALRHALDRLGAPPLAPVSPPPLDTPTESRARPRPWASTIDWGEVVTLRRRASEEITRALDEHRAEHGESLRNQDRLLLGRSIVRQVVRRRVEELATTGQQLWTVDTERAYQQAVMDAIFGYGRMQPLFEIPEAENIEIHGWDSVVVQYGDGSRVEHPPVADSDDELVEAIRFLGELSSPSRPFDDAHPMMTIALGDKFRLHAIGFGLSFRPSVVIRQHILTDISLAQLSGTGMFPPTWLICCAGR